MAAGGRGAMTPGANAITLEQVAKSFGAAPVVDDLSFTVHDGEIAALLGRTGAGKSTVLNLVMGTIAGDRGRVRVAGVDPFTHFRELRGKIAVSFQNDRLLPWRTAAENVELGLLILGHSRRDARHAAMTWIDRVKLTGAGDKYLHELSGGMRQRVSLARALAVDPDIILLDESFSQLDHVTSKNLRGDFHRIATELNKTCLFVTHRIDDALELADRVLVLAGSGKIALERTIRTAQRDDAAFIARLHDDIAVAMGGAGDEDAEPQ
jgi:NitT/TauT family transport system ATP-binding protein